MELRTLGKTDVKITPLGLGCRQFSQGKGLKRTESLVRFLQKTGAKFDCKESVWNLDS